MENNSPIIYLYAFSLTLFWGIRILMNTIIFGTRNEPLVQTEKLAKNKISSVAQSYILLLPCTIASIQEAVQATS